MLVQPPRTLRHSVVCTYWQSCNPLRQAGRPELNVWMEVWINSARASLHINQFIAVSRNPASENGFFPFFPKVVTQPSNAIYWSEHSVHVAVLQSVCLTTHTLHGVLPPKKWNPLHDPINLSGTSTLWLISGLDYQPVKSIISPYDAACCKTFFGPLGSLN